ncbi:type IV secretory system conjugative DNA transfer family protein [Tamlana fucoidanivorans]|uniref:Type IV secretory system conjugative DNA transfer family protein n=1 Tax=Allotamlana fucoidanivorans TaxID=2583814 RepID=A0A5C4SQ20_9FLAO|nr:type IV secretory system conjugative DNA transfer family protein [Tamlana fucoidanivorans]TNJ46093.1 type IV secretory system conjugative DNA transfer family protein [Tamlana fucoidanivorans]
MKDPILQNMIIYALPIACIIMLLYLLFWDGNTAKVHKKYKMKFQLLSGRLKIANIRRGSCIIGSAGSGKTESVIYQFLKHFTKHKFCGIVHDYKDLELTELVYPLCHANGITLYTIAFDTLYYRVNPIAPKYLSNEESVLEVTKVLMENLLEQHSSESSGSHKFFSDAVEGLLSGVIWNLRSYYPQYCTLPHVIALFQYLEKDGLVQFLNTNITSRAMASAFLHGVDSEKQTAGVRSTLSNALKKLSTRQLFMALSADEVPLNVNDTENKGIIAISNHPKYETTFAPVIAMVIHTVVKQMSERGKASAFILMEEAPTIKLLHMHRIPATLRSYDITTVYVMQDKIQNDMLYGDKASRAIISNLSYQFFGKANDPDTAKYYESFFEIVTKPTRSVSKDSSWNFNSRITKGEKEVSKRRANEFFRLKTGQFVVFADGKDRKVQFRLLKMKKEKPPVLKSYSVDDLDINFQKIHSDIRRMFEAGK